MDSESGSEPSRAEIERHFERAMMRLYREEKEACGTDPAYFLQMIMQRGAVATAKVLTATSQPQTGFAQLIECGRLDLSVECAMLRPEFHSLFTPAELAEAQRRLDSVGYKPID